jgi:hypothetical protein
MLINFSARTMNRTFPSLFILLILICDTVTGQSIEKIGLAKSAESFGREVVYTIYVESLSEDTLRFVQVNDNLDATFGAGNYSIIDSPSATGFLCANPNFDGSNDTELLLNNPGCFLPKLGTAEITFRVSIETLADMGNGFGKYSNSATGVGRLITSTTAVDDISDWGTDPDPNGNSNPNEVGENDPTFTDILQNPVIGIAKSALLSGNEVIFRFYLENFGNRNLKNISIIDNLDATFGAGNYAVTSGPSFFDDPGTLTLNTGFDGSADNMLISVGTLDTAKTAGIQITIDVTTIADLGKGLGIYENQAKATAQSLTGQLVEDLSDDGTDPDPNGNGNPSEEGERGREGENDPTKITIGQQPVIGVAKTVTVSADSVSIDLYLENLGNTVLSNISLIENLKSVFGSGNFNIRSTQILDAASTLVLNSSFNENTNFELLQTSSTLAIGAVDTIQVIVENIIRTDQGFGTGVYKNQVFATATAPGGSTTSDYSDSGTDADPNGNGNPNEAGENDITSFSITSNPKIGIALEYRFLGYSGGSPKVALIYHVENLGNEPISNITVNHDLNAVYGAGNYIHLEDPTQTSGSPTFNYNAAFNGNANFALLNAGSTLAPGETSSFKIEHLVINITDQGFGLGIYQGQVTVNSTAPNSSTVTDVSHQGKEPDPNGNGDASDAGESDATVIDLNAAPSIGIALDANVSGNLVTFDVYLENLGNLDYSEVFVTANLDQVFGAGNYTLSTPSFIDNPGTITLSTLYNGTSDNSSLLVSGNSTLAVSETAQIRIIATVDGVRNAGLGLGNYSSQFSVSAVNSNGGTNEDQSDFGTDPDPNGNSEANEAGENDATTFNIAVSTVGIAQNSAVAGQSVTIDLYLENFASETLNSLSLTHNLDVAFGVGNYTISAAPTLITDPGTLVLDGSYNGSSQANILASGSTLGSGSVAQIQFVVTVDKESDQGNGFGVYSSQASITSTNSAGIVITDQSDDGTDPDPNGNSDPGEIGEDDSSSVIIVGSPAIGLAKHAIVNGNRVTLFFTIENLGNSTLSNVILRDPLNPVFGSGNYSVSSKSLVSGPSTLITSSNFLGYSVFDFIVAGGYIQPGEKIVVKTTINVTNVTDQGNGLGVFNNGVTVTGNDPGGNPITDVSDAGLEPDSNGNGNASDSGEDDVTVITIGDEANIGLALDASVTGMTVTFDYYIENFGGSILNNIDLSNDLDEVFGGGNYSIASAPSFVQDPGTLSLNASFDGSSSQNLITSGNLGTTSTAQIRVVVNVNTLIDKGEGNGKYSNQVSISASAPLGSLTSDLSDSGVEPDANGNNFPFDGGEADPTKFTVNFSSIGLAQEASIDCDAVITFKYYLKNLGTSMLDSIGLEHNLDGLFGVGQYTIVEAPSSFTEVRGLVLDNSFNGSSKTNLLLPGSTMNTIGSGSEIITMKVKLLNPTQITYKSGAKITATDNTSGQFFDLSDSGINPDANNDFLANEVGENDSTLINIFAPIVASITSQTNASCNGFANGAIDLNVSGGKTNYSYSWSNSTSLQDLSGLGPGTYTVTVTDANSCTATASEIITQPDVLAASINSQTNVGCNDLSNGSATVSASGGTASYAYSWSPSGGNLATASGLTAGSYTVNVTDANGCTATATTEIIFVDNLLSNISQHPINQSICQGNNATFSVLVNGSGINYQWQIESEGVFINLNNSGVYSGVNSANLLLSFPSQVLSGSKYRCKITQTSCEALSSEARLTVQIAAEAISIVHVSPIFVDLPENDGVVNSQAVSYGVAINRNFSGTRVSFKAGNSIELRPGFIADAGAIFSASIQNACNLVFVNGEGKDSIPKELIK